MNSYETISGWPTKDEVPTPLSNASRVEMLRRDLAEAEAREAKERADVEAKEAKRIAGLRTFPSLENHHERLGFIEDHRDESKDRLDRHERWLEVLSVKLFGAEHNLSLSAGDHAKAREHDAANPDAANRRDVEVAANKRNY